MAYQHFDDLPCPDFGVAEEHVPQGACDAKKQSIVEPILIGDPDKIRHLLQQMGADLDGFTLTHTLEPLELPDQEMVDGFLPPYHLSRALDPLAPLSMGILVALEYLLLDVGHKITHN